MADFSKTIADALQQGSRSRITAPTPPTTRNTDCNFCGGPHFIRECKVVDEYVLAGKCRRNYEGKVTLSTGAFVPRDIPGTLLRERVDEWHHRNPNQLSVASLVHTISTEHIRKATSGQAQPSLTLSAADRIVALEAELFSLRARRPSFVPAIRTRAQKAREMPSATIEEEEDEDVPAIEKGKTLEPTATPRMTVTPPQQTKIAQEPVVPTRSQPVVEPEHPFRNTRDAAYAPPVSRNVGVLPKPQAAKVTMPAYRTQPPIHDSGIATDVYKRAMNAPVTITQRELLSLSPELRSQVRDATTTRRVPTGTTGMAQESLLYTIDEEDEDAFGTPSFALAYQDYDMPPKGATMVADPFEAYYDALEPGEVPSVDRLTVAKESTAIRSVYALINTSHKRECTVDPGCQVIAMSETTCHSLGLAYDPKIRLNMESANGNFDWSLGLARNVAFLIGTVTIYLQVHIIRSPSYAVLLGRPFDVLTESIIRNFNNEDQTITMTDPNSGNQCTIPTFARGTHSSRASAPMDF
jgi:hypothetical protein